MTANIQKHIYSERALFAIRRHLDKHDDVLSQLPPLDDIISTIGIRPPISDPKRPKHKPVCIVGGGVAGLYTGMMFASLGIEFEILEADRVGGRLYTYNFPPPNSSDYEYYDVGAMRFPDTKFMWRTFDLARNRGLDLKLIPYIFTTPNTLLRFNGMTIMRDANGDIPKVEDPFRIKVTSPPNYVTDPLLSPGEPWNFLKHYMDKQREPFKNPNVDIEKALNDLYEKYDKYSTRSWLFEQTNFTTGNLHYLETIGGSTGFFDRAFTEDVIDSLAFDWPDPEEGAWYCFDHGSSEIAKAMAKNLEKSLPNASEPFLKLKTTVTAIGLVDIRNPKSEMKVTYIDPNGRETSTEYSAVISTVPFGCLSMMDLTRSVIEGFNYPQWSGFRELQYGEAIKVGMRFTEAWWGSDNVGPKIIGGQSYTDLPIRLIVYPSYPEFGPKSNVLIVSYARVHDGERLGAWIHPDGTVDPRFINVIFRDLAAVHGVPEEKIRKYWKGGKDNYYAFDWVHNPFSMGAFAFFGPGEFVDAIYNQVCQPAAAGKLFFAGEATSSCHAWVAGALDSAWRAVYQYLRIHHPDKVKKFKEDWGESEYWYDTKKKEGNKYGMMEDILRLGLRHAYYVSQ